MLQDANDALAQMRAPDNDERDRLLAADEAIAAAKKLSPAELDTYARNEFDRFLSWLRNRIATHDYGDDPDHPTGRIS